MDKGLKSIILMVIRAGIIFTLFAAAGLMLCVPLLMVLALAAVAAAAGCFTKIGSRIMLVIGAVCLMAAGAMRLNLIPDPLGRCLVAGEEQNAALRSMVDRLEAGSPNTQSLEAELKHLKRIRDDGLLTEAEYAEARLASLRRFGGMGPASPTQTGPQVFGAGGAGPVTQPTVIAPTPNAGIQPAAGAAASEPGAQP
jgi:hypothetical protein